MLRLDACAPVQVRRSERAWQADLAKTTWTTSSPLASLAGCHPTRCCPAGQVDLLLLAVNGELRDIQRAWGVRLPAWVDMHGPNKINGMGVTALEDALGADIAGIHQMLGWQQARRGQMRLDGVEGLVILLNRRGGVCIGDEMRAVVVAALGQMHVVSHPLQAAFTAVAQVRVIQGAEPFTDRRALLG